MYKAFLIKYAEIGIKGKNRYMFEDALVRQIKYALDRCEGEFEVRKTQGRIYIDAVTDFDYDETIDNLKTVFGISSICPMVYVEDEGFEKLQEDVNDYMRKAHPNCQDTFKVFCRRGRKDYPLESMEVSAKIGASILKAFPNTTFALFLPTPGSICKSFILSGFPQPKKTLTLYFQAVFKILR